MKRRPAFARGSRWASYSIARATPDHRNPARAANQKSSVTLRFFSWFLSFVDVFSRGNQGGAMGGPAERRERAHVVGIMGRVCGPEGRQPLGQSLLKLEATGFGLRPLSGFGALAKVVAVHLPPTHFGQLQRRQARSLENLKL